MSDCMYCRAPVDATVYDGTCLDCTARLLVILGHGAIERRLRIEKRKGSDAALRKAIKEARRKAVNAVGAKR